MTFISSVTLRLLLSRLSSVFGNTAAAIVLPLVLLDKTGSPLAAGTLSLCVGVPQFLAGIFGGAALDRFNRRTVSIVSDIISALCVAALPLTDLLVGLNLQWFILFGVMGAIGDIPGMTARSVLLPPACQHDNLDVQRFVGISQAVDSLAGILGPAFAAVLMGLIGSSSALWITAGFSLLGALITCTVPRSIGEVSRTSSDHTTQMPLKDGLNIIFRSNRMVLTSILLSAGILILTICYQNLVFPVYFTEIQQPEHLGYVLSMMSLGLLIGPVIYAALVDRLSKRRWYVLSLLGTAISMSIMGSLATESLIFFGAVFAGICCGPFSALLGYLLIDIVPADKLGAVLGMQNAFMLLIPPVGVFISSLLVNNLGTHIASYVLIGCMWLLTLCALTAKSMRNLNDL